MRCLIFVFLLIACVPKNNKSELFFSEIAEQESFELDGMTTSKAVAGLSSKLILHDRVYMLNKYVDLFGLEKTQLGPDHHIETLYDRIRPVIYQYGIMGGGCDLYGSTNAWPPIVEQESAVPYPMLAYALEGGINQQGWFRSCWHFYKDINTFQGLGIIKWQQDVVSTPARYSVNSRICSLLIEERLDYFIEQKLNLDLNSLIEIDEDIILNIFKVFHPAYITTPEEIDAVYQIIEEVNLSEDQPDHYKKFKVVVNAICQSPFWHTP